MARKAEAPESGASVRYAQEPQFSGTRPLSGVLEHKRVMRNARDASLEEAFVYVVKDKQVIPMPLVKFTPKYAKFDTGHRQGTRDNAPPWCAYAERQAFEAGKPASIVGGPANLSMRIAFRTREAAEEWLAEWERPRSRARATDDEARIIREAHRAMDARGRGKGGIHSTTEACRVIRELLSVLAAITGIDSASETLPFQRS